MMESQTVIITPGNKKLGKTANVSLPAGISCPKGIPCFTHGCYTRNYSWRSTVKKARLHNWRLLQTNITNYFKDIAVYLGMKKPAYFRWHVDGDIPSQNYLDHMVKLAHDFPSTQMLVFTKNYNLDFTELPVNLTVILSLWPGLDIPPNPCELPVAWMYDPREIDTRIRGYFIHCPGQCEPCRACWNAKELEKDILFSKH